MQINDTKAGMENIDKEKINAIILKHSQSKGEFSNILRNKITKNAYFLPSVKLIQ